jgi:hypothetical protein
MSKEQKTSKFSSVVRGKVPTLRHNDLLTRCIGADDKRQITAMIAVTLTGEMLPVQLIFQGKTARVEPDASKHVGHITTTHSANHWANVDTTMEFLRQVAAYRNNVIDKEGLLATTPALLIWDVFYTHREPEVMEFCRRNNIHLLFVPANCTSFLQLCDVAVNKSWKSSLANSFVRFLADVFQNAEVNPGDDAAINIEAFQRLTSVAAVRELTVESVRVAIEVIKSSGCIESSKAPSASDSTPSLTRPGSLFGRTCCNKARCGSPFRATTRWSTTWW